MNKFNIFLFGLIILFGLGACETLDNLDKIPEPDVKYSATYPINGEYYIMLDMFDGTNWVEDPYSVGYHKITFSNTSANETDKVWFDDLALWPSRAKVKCDPATKTFVPGTYNANFEEKILKPADTAAFHSKHLIDYKYVATLDKNTVIDSVLVSGYKISVTVISGSIEIGTFEAPSKTKTDAINIELEWSDDPGVKYRYKGYRRTGFLEDEH